MGIGFVAFGWIILVFIFEILFSPVTIYGFNKFRKTKKKAYLLFLTPAISVIVLPTIAIIVGIINFIFWGTHGPNTMPSEKDVIGEYWLTPNSREFLITKKEYQRMPDTILITLESNQILNFQNMPDCLFNGFGESKGNFSNKIDKWNIEKSSSIESWFSGWPISPGGFYLTGNPPAYQISVTVGDPDNGEDLTFRKIVKD